MLAKNGQRGTVHGIRMKERKGDDRMMFGMTIQVGMMLCYDVDELVRGQMDNWNGQIMIFYLDLMVYGEISKRGRCCD
ncbi:unnamed protein product [Gordionus sp. m RMFG-2023]